MVVVEFPDRCHGCHEAIRAGRPVEVIHVVELLDGGGRATYDERYHPACVPPEEPEG